MAVRLPKILFFVALLYPYICLAQAGSEKEVVNQLFKQTLKKVSCEKKIEKKLSSSLGDKEWVPLLISEPEQNLKTGIVFRNSKTGMAYSIYGDMQSATYTVLNKKTDDLITTTWSVKSCEETILKTKFKSNVLNQDVKKTDDYFTDADLVNTMQKNTWGVIYIWSPYMPLSVDALAEIKKAVTAEKGHLTILMDKKAGQSQAEKWIGQGSLQKQDLKKVSANELFDRGLGVHYPTAYIYQDGFLANADFVGFKTADQYLKWIQVQKKIIQKDLR